MKHLLLWLMRVMLAFGMCLVVVQQNEAVAQSSSLFRRTTANTAGLTVQPSQPVAAERKSAVSNVSFFAVKPLPKKLFKIGDLVTVIVRQKSIYKHYGKSKLDREWDIKAELKDWIRFKERRLIPVTIPEGDPKIDFNIERNYYGRAKKDRIDEVITRITCKVIDVMPNGSLILQGGPDIIETDGEKQIFTLTGTCRSEDISADNTILSTQLLECNFKRTSTGAVRDVMRRSWVDKLWDMLRPF